ncbi:MAG: TraR/DksA family transcriptional regulator [Spirochaetes bacterium]|nr:MAG: TraR/DksA family transcriptional regulator [Spirochaetota bacterium]
MNDEFKAKMKQRLFDLKAEVLTSLIAENNDFRAAVEDSGVNDLADMASNDIDAMTLEALGAKDKLRLQRIESALARIENGKFGICASCGSRIQKERLNAIPYSVLCVSCQSTSERHRAY